MSVIINIGLLLLFFLLFEPTTKSDDYDMMNILYGGWNGESSPFILYSSPIYGYILCFLFRLFPSLPWYFIMQYLLMLWGMIEITRVLLEKTKITVWLVLPLLSFIYYECFIRITFTKTAGLLIACGYLLLFFLIDNNRKITVRYLSGIILIILGILIRKRMFLLVTAIFAGGFLAFLLLNRKNLYRDTVRKIVSFVIMTGVLVVIFIVIGKVNSSVFSSDSEWKEYHSINTIRAQLFDFGVPDYDLYEEEYKKLGISKNDYNTWFVAAVRDDPELLTPELMVKIRSIAPHEDDKDANDQFTAARYGLLSWCFSNTMFYFFLCSCLLIIITQRRKSWIILPVLAVCLFSYFYLILSGRTQHHVDAVIFIAGSIQLLYFCEFSSRIIKTEIAISTILLGLCFIQTFNSELESSSYYGTSFGIVGSQKEQYAANKAQLDLLVNDNTHLYLFNPYDTNTIYPAFTIWEVIPADYYHNLHRLNMDHIPIHKNVLDDYNVTNPLKEAVNSNVIYYYVSNQNKIYADIVWEYIKENYSPDVKREEVKRTQQGIVYWFYTDDFLVDETELCNTSTLDYEMNIKELENDRWLIEGYIYEEETDSFAQNVYIKVKNLDSGIVNYYPTKQDLNDDKKSDKDLYHGLYSWFSQVVSLEKSDLLNLEVNVILVNSNGTYTIPLLSQD